MIETVILAISGGDSDRAVALADTTADLAGPSHATVHVVLVMGPDEFERIAQRLGYDPSALPEPETVAKRFKTVRSVAGHLVDPGHPSGFPVEVHGLVAEEPGPALVDLAAEFAADRIVIGGRERSPSGKALFGSDSQYILLNADCPVVLVRPEHATRDQDTVDENAFEAIAPPDAPRQRGWRIDP